MSTNPVSGNESSISRREVLRRGLCGAAGLLAADRLAAQGLAAPTPTRSKKAPLKVKAKSVIQIFLWGGMSHNDTWDPKPESGQEYMGEFSQVISTNVPGIRLGALFPELAKQADKYSLIRSMTHRNNGHETAAYLMQTGHAPGERLAYPSVGAVFALFKSRDYKGILPPYVVLTRAQGRFSEEGFLGPKYKPFATGGDPNAARFEVEGVVARGITDDRQKRRRELLEETNTMGGFMAASSQLKAAEDAKKAAYELILGQGKQVFDLSKENPKLRDRYGRHMFGQECLVARRLVESGVPTWYQLSRRLGTHSNHFHHETQCQTGPGPGHAAGRPSRPRLAGEHHRVVFRRVRPWPQDRLGATLERRPQPLRQRLFGAGGRRGIQRRPNRRVVGRTGPRGQGAARLPRRSSGKHLPVGRHRPERQIAASHGVGGSRVALRGGRGQVGRTSDRDHVTIVGELAGRGFRPRSAPEYPGIRAG